MDSKPLVTVITPSFNQVEYLPLTIRSVINQNYPNIEYLIVDGGSTDGSVDLIEKFASSSNGKISWWMSEKDNGQADAINKGFAKSSGEIIAWLNSDDIYMNGTIEHVVKIFEANPQAGMVYSDVFSIDAESQLINVMRFEQWGLYDLMAFNIISQPGVFVRREALQAAGFLDEGYQYLLDHHFWLRIAEKYPIKHFRGFFAAARFHSDAKNIAKAVEFGSEAFKIVDWMRSRPVMSGLFARNHRKILAGAYRFSARYLLDGGKVGKSIIHYLKSFWFSPPVAIKEFNRFIYALFRFFPFVEKFKQKYLQKRTGQMMQDKIVEEYQDLTGFIFNGK